MSKIVLTAPFDPITQQELDDAKKIAKEHGECYLYVEEDGILPRSKRIDFVLKAIKPFKHLHLVLELDEHVTIISNTCYKEYEHEVQCGKFYKAANGIKKNLSEEGLYLMQVLKANCNPHRAAHSVAVANVCKDLASHHGLDVRRAYIAGMLHDVTKAKSDEWNKHVLSIYDEEKLVYSNKVWHSFTCPIFIKQNMMIHDEKILNAIYHHTLGTSTDPYAMILYIADKCEPTRGYDSTFELELSRKNLKEGFDLVYQEAQEYIKNNPSK